MNLVDSSGWLEYLADTNNARHFARAIEYTSKLIVPSITVLEVFKRVLSQRGEDAALQAVTLMRQGRVVDLDFSLALLAAKLGVQHKLPMADSIILATARTAKAVLWTQDSHFEGLDNVKFFSKR